MLSGVEAVETPRNQSGFRAAIDLDGLVDGELVSAGSFGEIEEFAPELDCERERELAVRDRSTEGSALCPLGVYVDPLVVVGCVREEVDALLGYLEPVGVAQIRAGEAAASE